MTPLSSAEEFAFFFFDRAGLNSDGVCAILLGIPRPPTTRPRDAAIGGCL